MMNSFNVIDVAQLGESKSAGDQQAMIVRGIISQIVNRALSGDRHTPFVIVLEEHLQSLLAHEEFVYFVHRALRRCTGILVSMGQELACFQKNAGSKCLLGNGETTCVFSLTEDLSAEQVWDIPTLYRCIDLLQTPCGNSEMVMVGSDWAFKGKVFADAFLKVLYSSEGSVRQKFKAFSEQGYGLKEAISKTAKEMFGKEHQKKQFIK